MPSSFARLLVLGCSLLLALPPGWCCMFASGGHKQDAPKVRPCCRSCCGKESGSPTPAPAPRPAPAKPDRCPCADRLSTAPDTAKVFAADPPLVAPLADFDFTFSRSAAGSPAGFRPPAPAASACLLNCVWLC